MVRALVLFCTPKIKADSWFTSKGTGATITAEKEYKYTSEVYSDREIERGRFAFNTDMFAELSVFNSSFLTFKISRNFASSDFVKINGDYTIEGTPVSVESLGNINGFLFDLGYKLPLKVLNRQLKLERKTIG